MATNTTQKKPFFERHFPRLTWLFRVLSRRHQRHLASKRGLESAKKFTGPMPAQPQPLTESDRQLVDAARLIRQLYGAEKTDAAQALQKAVNKTGPATIKTAIKIAQRALKPKTTWSFLSGKLGVQCKALSQSDLRHASDESHVVRERPVSAPPANGYTYGNAPAAFHPQVPTSVAPVGSRYLASLSH